MRAAADPEVWTVDSRGTVRTPISWLTPRARNAFIRLVGETGLEALLKDRAAKGSGRTRADATQNPPNKES